MTDRDRLDDADAYARVANPKWIKRRADAEWAAMDDWGRLPAGWTPPC